MKHGKKILKIGRNASHRKATLQSMSAALLEHKRITTTFGKAKALRRFVEPVITKAKDDSTHGRRQAFKLLNDKEAVKTLYNEVAEVVGDRPGGYTRIVKLGQRAGDAAEMAIVELVDFNDVKPDGSGGRKRKTRRSRSRSRGGSSSTPEATQAEATEEAVLEVAPETPDVDTPSDNEGTDATTPDAQGAVEVPPHGDDHPDASQGAATQTGEPGPGADAENMGRSHDNR